MSIYKDKRSQYFTCEIQYKGHTDRCSTGETTRAGALAFERQKREEVIKAYDAGAFGAGKPKTLGQAIIRYWDEFGKDAHDAKSLKHDLAVMSDFFGEKTPIDKIDDNAVTKFVVWKKSQYRFGDEKYGKVSAARVNRCTWQLLSRVFHRAINYWNCYLPKCPKWRRHRLAEPERRDRILEPKEFSVVFGAIDPEYRKLFMFALATGMRQESSMLSWQNVDRDGNKFSYIGKGGKHRSKPMTPGVARIIESCLGHDNNKVFTYVAKRTIKHSIHGTIIKGRRYPITQEGLKTHWRRLKAKLGIVNLTWHDLRRTYGTLALEITGNLALVQELLDHSDPNTTRLYAHVRPKHLRDQMAVIESTIFGSEFKPIAVQQIEYKPDKPEQQAEAK